MAIPDTPTSCFGELFQYHDIKAGRPTLKLGVDFFAFLATSTEHLLNPCSPSPHLRLQFFDHLAIVLSVLGPSIRTILLGSSIIS